MFNEDPIMIQTFTIKEAAKFLGISKSTLRRYEERDWLVPVRYGRLVRYPKDKVFQFARTGTPKSKVSDKEGII